VKARVLIFLGAPGSGKGTQAKKLCEKFPGWLHVSTGDLFRKEIASGSELGKSVQEIIASGKLVSDDTTNQVFASQVERLLSQGPVKGLILDGYPRTRPQTQFLIDFCRKSGKLEDPKAIELLVSEEAVVERLSNRLINPRSGRVYHKLFSPPRVPGKDDEDGGELIQRDDDKPEVIRSRFKLYTSQRDGIVNELGNDRVNQVPGEGETSAIAAQLSNLL